MRYFLYIAFNGANYCGWQRQPNGPSVQEEIERALRILYKREILLTGAGRTDAGVHAYSLPAHVDLDQLTAGEVAKLRRNLNGILPRDIYICSIRKVTNQAHARFDAISREYHYFVTREKDPFSAPFVVATHHALDVNAMNEAAQTLLGENDYTSFTKLHNDATHNRCQVFRASWHQTVYPGVWCFTIVANRFLRNMVRTIVGTLLEVGRGVLSPEDVKTILASKDRSQAATTAKPNGLFMREVTYPESIFLAEESDTIN